MFSMLRENLLIALVMMIKISAATVAYADPTLDTLILGSPESEKAHGLRDEFSQIIKGGLDQNARQLLPRTPASYLGGNITFTVSVDPKKQNYITAKLWGSDKGDEHGELALFAGDQQIGYRSEGDYDILNHCDTEGQSPGRFFYQTAMIPLSLTKGKTSLELTIKSYGQVWWYGSSFEKFQKNLVAPTRGLYSLYTHTNTRFTPLTSEVEGKLESKGIRPSPGEEVIDQSKKIVIDRITRILEKLQEDLDLAGGKKRESRLALLSEAYHVAWTPAYQNPKALEQLIKDCDDTVRAAAKDIKVVEGGWMGLGPIGGTLHRTWAEIKDRMDEKVELGVENAATRREAYAIMLRKSVDYWRTHRRGYTNQSMIVDSNIWQANRGLQLIKPELALPEAQAIRYLYEAVGLEPWRGSDEDAKDANNLSAVQDRNEATWKFGDYHTTVTRKGLSREVGWVGTYGETIFTFTKDMVELTGDARIREQLRKMHHMRMYFRYPGVDRDGYRCMKLVSEIDNRTAHYPKAGACYNAPEIGESWWMEIPAMLNDDPIAVGAAQQCLADNQYFYYIASRLKDGNTLGMMRNVDEYTKVKSLSPASYRLPGGDDQPDFVFADEQDAVVAIKHGKTHLFFNLYFRSFFGINGVARILEVSPETTRIASVRSDFEIENTAGTYVRPDFIHSQYTENRNMLPPAPLPHQALAGEELPVAAPPKGLTPLKPPVWGPFAGKADFYQLRYGDYLIGLNTTADKTFTLDIPADAPANAVDLVTGKKVVAKQSLPITPSTTTVIYIGK